MNCKTFVPRHGQYKGKEITSELFSDLLDHFKGDTDAANRAYGVAFSSQFMDYFGGDWTTEPVANATAFTEPPMQQVLSFIASQFKEEQMLTTLSEEVEDSLRHTELANLIIPELGVNKQQTVVDFIASLITKNILDAKDQKRFSEEELFAKIEEYFRAKLKEYKEVDEKQSAEIRKIIRNLPKLQELSKDKLRKLGQVTISEEQEDDATFEKTSYEDNATFKIDGKTTMSARLRRFFSFIPDAFINKDGEIEDKTAYAADMVEIVPFDTVYNTLTSLLSGQRADYKGMIAHLESQIEAHPWLQNVIEKLEEADETVKTDFVVAMSKHYVSMKFVMWERMDNGNYSLRVFDANANAIQRQILEEWYNNFTNGNATIANPKDGADLIMNPLVVEKLVKQFESWFDGDPIKSGYKLVSTEKINQMRKEGRQWLATLGIEMSDKAWGEIAAYKGKWFTGLFKNKSGVFRLLYENMKFRGDQSLTTDNPFSGSAFNKLAKIEARYTRHILSNSHRTGSETVYSHTLNKYNIKRVRDLKENAELANKLKQISFSKDSLWLNNILQEHEEKEQAIKEGEEAETPWLDNFQLHYMGLEAIKQMANSQDGPEMKQTDSAEHEVVKLALFQNKGNNTVYFMYPTMSDKTTMMVVEAPKVKVRLDAKEGISQETIDLLYSQMVLPELNRILYFQEGKEINDAGFEKGWHMFYMIPELNNLTELFNEDGKLRADVLSNKDLLTVIKDAVRNHVENLVNEKMDEWSDLGIGKNNLARDNRQVMSFLDHTYMATQMDPLAKTANDKLNFAATDYVINYLIANSNLFQTVIGDPALFFKSGAKRNAIDRINAEGNNLLTSGPVSEQFFTRNFMNDEERIAAVEDTFLNIGKRLAGDMAPGYDLEDQENNSFKVLFIKDAKISSEASAFFESLQLAAAGEYGAIESTDAQELTTLSEHLYVMRHTGKMNAELYDRVQRIISAQIAAENFYYMEAIQKELDEKDWANFKRVVYQPIKPVYVNNVTDIENNIDRRLYIKSSSFPLSPDLVAGTQLDNLRIMMEKNSIDRAAFHTATKVGAPSEKYMPTIVSKDIRGIDESIIDALDKDKEALAKTTRVLPRAGFRIQQEIPYDPDKKEINVGTQERKLLFNNILKLKGFRFEGKPYTGEKLLHEYNSRYEELFAIANKDLIHELGGKDGLDLEKLRKMLTDEAVKRNYPINDLYALKIDEQTGKFIMPLWASSSADRIQALLNSIIDNRVRKMEFPGKSLVLGTQEGFKVKEAEKVGLNHNGITFVEGFNPVEGLKSMRVENGEFKPGQILMPFKFLDNQGKALDIKNFTVEKDGKTYLDTSKFDNELLKVFGFRIPTQGHNSMAYFEIVGFLPKSAGDLIIAPRELVKQMGSDFDVDKLYLYMHHTEYSQYDKETQDKIDRTKAELNEITTANPDVFVPRDKTSKFFAIRKEENYLRKILKDIKGAGKFKLGTVVGDKFQEGSVNSKEYLPNAGIDSGDRLITSFRAAVTNIIGTGKFNNPDKVDFKKLKDYTRNLMDNDVAKLKRIDASTFDDRVIEGKEKLSDWITDPLELVYAKALKIVIIKFNQGYKEQVSAVYDALARLEELRTPLQETIEEKHAIQEKLKDLKKQKNVSIKKVVRDRIDPFKEISDLKEAYGLGKIEESLPAFIKENGIKATRSFIQGELVEVREHIDTLNGEEKINALASFLSFEKRMLDFVDNYKKNLQNDIIDMHFSVMSNTSDEMQRQIHAPLAYGDLKGGKDLAAKIDNARKSRLQNDSTFSPMSDTYQKSKFINAMAGRVGGVGVFSLDSVLNTMIQQGTAISGSPIYARRDEDSGAPLRIMFGSKVSHGDLSRQTVIGNDDKNKSDVIAAYQSAAVDNEKEQIMDKINVNNHTYDVIRILNQLGFEEDIVAPFISQDIIFDYVRELVHSKNSLQEYDPAAKMKAQKKVLTKYFKGMGIEYKNMPAEEAEKLLEKARDWSDIYSAEDMMRFIEKGKADPDFYKAQVGLLAKFIYLEDYGVALKRIQSAINTDSAGIGKSYHNSIAKIENVYNLHNGLIAGGEQTLGKYILDEKGRLVSINYNTINGFATKYALMLNSMWNELFPFSSDVVTTLMEEVLVITDKQNLPYTAKADMYESIWKEIKSYMFSMSKELNLSTLNSEQERKRLLFDVVNNADPTKPVIEHMSLPRILEALKDSEYVKNNAFLNRLRSRIGKGDLPSTISFNATTAENYDEINLYASFMEMLIHPVTLGEFNGQTLTSQDLGRELILYSFITGGLQEATQFIKYIPIEYLQKIGFAKMLTDFNFYDPSIFGASIIKTDPYQYSTFTQQYVQHNPAQVKRGEISHFTNEANEEIKNLKDVDVIQISAGQEITLPDGSKASVGHVDEYIVERGSNREAWMTEFVSFRDDSVPQKYHLFKYIGENKYERIPVLGTRSVGKKHVNPIKEYSANNPFVQSSINNFTQLKDAKKKVKAAVPGGPQKPGVIKAIAPKVSPVKNVFIDEMDMVSGDKTVIKDVLSNIVDLTTNLGYREYAEQLLSIIDKVDVQWNLEIVKSPDKPFLAKIVHTNLGQKGYAVNIQINESNVNSRAELEEAVLHELTHAFTTDLIQKYYLSPDKLTAQQKGVIARLESLQKTYRKAITQEYGLDENTDLKAYVKLNKDGLDRDTLAQLYAGHNLQEFFALGMTSPEFQEKLNDKGLFAKFLDLVTELLKAMGFTIEDDITKAVVKDITTLIRSKVDIEPTFNQPPIAPTIPARLSSKEKPLKVFVDGSDIKSTGKIGYGVHLKYQGKSYNTSGHYNLHKGGLEKLQDELGITLDNHPSNGVMEIYGSLVAIQNTPKGEFLTIYQDLEGVQLWILSRLIMRLTDNMHLSEDAYKKTFWKNLSMDEKKKIHAMVKEYVNLDSTLLEKKVYEGEGLSKGNFTKDKAVRTIADKIIDEILQRKGKISYQWVRGHSGIEGNEAVDSVAKDENNYNQMPDLFNETVSKPVATKTTNDPSIIYSYLGGKTVSENIVIKSWGILKDSKEAVTPIGIVSTRIKNTNRHFGNPFSNDEKVLTQNPSLIKTSSTRESVEKYINWVINSNDERAVWIRQQLQSGQLKGKPIIYYKELGEPSHATALDYLINKYLWPQGQSETKVDFGEDEMFAVNKSIDYFENKLKTNPSKYDAELISPLIEEIRQGNMITSDMFPPFQIISTLEMVLDFFEIKAPTALKNKNGVPKVLVHGSKNRFKYFDATKLGENTGAASAKQAFFATIDIDTALSYGKKERTAPFDPFNPDDEIPSSETEEGKAVSKGNYFRLVKDTLEDSDYGPEIVVYDAFIYPILFLSNKIKEFEVNKNRKSIGSFYEQILLAKKEGYDTIIFRDVVDSKEPDAKATDIFAIINQERIVNVFTAINDALIGIEQEDSEIVMSLLNEGIISKKCN